MSEQLDDKLELLLINKPFNVLSLMEKEYALQLISEEEYNQYHLLLSKSRLALNDAIINLPISPEIAESLRVAFKVKYKKSFLRTFRFESNNFKIPVYPITLASIAIVICIIFFANPFNILKQQSVVQKIRPARIVKKVAAFTGLKKEEGAFEKTSSYEVSVLGKNAGENLIQRHISNKRISKKNPKVEIRDSETIANYLCSDALLSQGVPKSKRIDSTTLCISIKLIIPSAETYNSDL